MLMKADRTIGEASPHADTVYRGLLIAAAIVVAFIVFSSSLLELVRRWIVQEEYSHGFLIPIITGWILWTRRDALLAGVGEPSWLGAVVILLAATLHLVGKLSALYFLSQVGFILVLVGIVLACGGTSLFRAAFLPIIFLFFAIPLPYVVDAGLSLKLQLISSQLGVFVIRLFDIPVYLEGNVIDLGVYKLQVVDACSGLRYLYPLMSLGFLAAYLFQAPFWQRTIVFLSTIPITIAMNSLRIGIVGVLVDHFGPQDADGFLHMFEGWIIFIACAGLLAAEMCVLARVVSRRKFFDVFYVPKPVPRVDHGVAPQRNLRGPLFAGVALVFVTGLAVHFVSERPEINPARKMFATFPANLGKWQGRTSSLDPQTEHGLGLTDYILSDYANADERPVNLYVAYYASQRTGASPHSPSVCIPGNGWQITNLQRMHYDDDSGRLSLPLNRVVIAKGSQKQLVYYWFEERGMKIANEYWSKLYLLRDAVLKNRTDGALVRLTTPVFPGESELDADKRLQHFMQLAVPALAPYLPAPPGSDGRYASIRN